MNQSLYRIVLNDTCGAMMVVADAASSCRTLGIWCERHLHPRALAPTTHSIKAGGAMTRWAASMAVVSLLAIGTVSPARAVTYYATYKLNGGMATQSNQTYFATATDTSGVWVTNSGVLTLNNCTITTTGNTSSQDNSSFYGLNAGVLAAAGTITMSGGSVTTSGTGANGAFARRTRECGVVPVCWNYPI
jgi:hypothetical protein